MTRLRNRRRRGFTLIEVLLVLVILVVLASFAVVQFGGVRQRASIDAARAQIGLFESAFGTYEMTVGSYPMGRGPERLQALVVLPPDVPDPSKWAGPYLNKDVPLDPWEHPYQYAYPGIRNPSSFDVWSSGPDGVDGTDDDIGNWK